MILGFFFPPVSAMIIQGHLNETLRRESETIKASSDG
jgi:hypothetical protein